MRAIILTLGLLAVPAAAADAEQFDLVCRSGDSTYRYRVDLAKGEACSDTCDRIWKMGPATTGELKVIERVPAYRGDLEERSVVNRLTGEWRYHMSLNGRVTAREGSCEVANFSGFPAQRF